MSVEVSNTTALARIYRALGEPTRVRIVQLLAAHDELSCTELVERLDLAASTLSHHLSLLQACGLLEVRKSGTYHFYRLRRDVLARYAPAVL